ncbi:MAG: MFS transporter, partial [Bacteroidota bacterium]
GAILASAVLFFVPNSSALWMAAGSLWILDASINISMEPFRALVADKLPPSQRSLGFVIQALIIGVGTWIASSLPWLVNQFGVPNVAEGGGVPPSVKMAFAIGAAIFMAAILITVLFTKEYSPKQVEAFQANSHKTEKKHKGARMPSTMKKLGVVQFFSWFAFFSMWAMATPALTSHIFDSPAPQQEVYNMDDPIENAQFEEMNQKYNNSADLVSRDMGIYGLSSMGFALILTLITAFSPINRRLVHMISLACGGVGFFLMYMFPSPNLLWLYFALIGISWGSILSMPYAMLASSIDETKMGWFMGLFNMFIVIPQILAALLYKGLYYKSETWEPIFENPIWAIVFAGISLLVASVANLLITDPKAISHAIGQLARR